MMNVDSTQLLFDLSDDNDSHKRLASLDTELMNCYQRARGTKKFIDIDCDVPDDGVNIKKEELKLLFLFILQIFLKPKYCIPILLLLPY